MGAGSVSTTQSRKIGSTIFLKTDSTTGYTGFSYTVPANSVLRLNHVTLSGSFVSQLFFRYGSPAVNMKAFTGNGEFEYVGGLELPAGTTIFIGSGAFQDVYVLGYLITNSP